MVLDWTLAVVAILVYQLPLSSAEWEFEVGIHRFSNPLNQDYNGACCETSCSNQCDHYFVFCLRVKDYEGNQCPRGIIQTFPETLSVTTTTFTPVPGGGATFVPGISNPLVISKESRWTSGGFQLLIRIEDDDTDANDLIDELTINRNLAPNETFTITKRYTGIYGAVKMDLSFRVRCSQNFYGSECDIYCEGRDDSAGHYVCDANGDKVCLDGWTDLNNNCLMRALSITDPIQFTLESIPNADPLVFTLTCIYTGGPATTVTWTTPAGAIGTESQTLTDQSTFTYSNTLTVIGRHTGDYMCSVTNYTEKQTLTVFAADPLTVLRVIVAGKNNITVFWTAPMSDTTLGYVIFYQLHGNTVENITIDDSSDTNVTISGLENGGQYSITMVALSSHLPSPSTGPTTITVAAPDVAPEVTIQRMNGTHMNVSWMPLHPDDARGEVISYTVRYRPTDGSPENMTIDVPGSQSYVIIGGLEPQLTYQVVVWASTAAGSGRASDPEEVPLQSSSSNVVVVAAATVGILLIVIGLASAIIMWLVVRFHHHTSFSPQKDRGIEMWKDPGVIPVGECVAYEPHDHGEQQTEDHEYETLPEPPVGIGEVGGGGGGGGGGKRGGGEGGGGSEPVYEVGVTTESPPQPVKAPPDGGREEVASAATTAEPVYEYLP